MRKRRLILSLVAVAVLFGLVATPSIRWPVVGWARGEPFWHGRPSSYYADRFRTVMRLEEDGRPTFRRPAPGEDWGRKNLPRGITEVIWGGWSLPLMADDPPDTDALPVLRRLLHDPDVRVRWSAASSIVLLREDALPVVPELVALLDDPHLCGTAVVALQAVGP